MIDVMSINCPHCNRDFSVDIYIGEEAKEYNAVLTRSRVQHVSWEEIKSEILNGYGNAILSIGDKITFRLKNGRTVSVSVVALNMYSENNVIFMFDDSICNQLMNVRDTNRGGWAESEMADFLDKDILSTLPDELIGVISDRDITQKIGNSKYKRTSKLWLPSRTEMFGEGERYKEVDFGDKHFPLFNTEKSRVKSDESGETIWYWLRSPYVSFSTYFWTVANYGGSNYYGASGACGVCPCFIIGRMNK